MTSSTAKFHTAFQQNAVELIQEEDLPYTPQRVNHKKLNPKGNLVSQAHWVKIYEQSRNDPPGLYIKQLDNHYCVTVLKLQHVTYVLSDVCIGSGAKGVVYPAQNEKGHWAIAKLTMIDDDSVDNSDDDYVMQSEITEYEFSREAEVTIDANGPVRSKIIIPFSDSEGKPVNIKCAMLLKDGKGLNLYQFINTIKSNKNFPEVRYLDIINQLIHKVIALFKKGIMHCDIKLENIIYNEIQNLIMLIDFDLAMKLENGKDFLYGTFRYMPPEFLKTYIKIGSPKTPDTLNYEYNEKTLSYTLGRVIKELLGIKDSKEEALLVSKLYDSFEKIFNGEKLDAGVEKIFTGEELDVKDYEPYDFTVNQTYFSEPTPQNKVLHAFVKRMCDLNPDLRPDLTEIGEFFKKFRENHHATLEVGLIDIQQLVNIQARLKNCIYPNLEAKIHGEIITHLNDLHEVQLVSSAKSTPEQSLERAEVINILRNAGIMIRKKIVVHPNIFKLASLMPTLFAHEDKIENTTRHYQVRQLFVSPIPEEEEDPNSNLLLLERSIYEDETTSNQNGTTVADNERNFLSPKPSPEPMQLDNPVNRTAKENVTLGATDQKVETHAQTMFPSLEMFAGHPVMPVGNFSLFSHQMNLMAHHVSPATETTKTLSSPLHDDDVEMADANTTSVPTDTFQFTTVRSRSIDNMEDEEPTSAPAGQSQQFYQHFPVQQSQFTYSNTASSFCS